MFRVGVVAEGPYDHEVLGRMVRELLHDSRGQVEILPLHPPALPILGGGPGAGWMGVRAWCRQHRSHLDALMTGVTGMPLHLLVLHVDASMADKVEANRPCPPALDTGRALEDVILSDWLALDPPPPYLVLAVPAQTTDTWASLGLEPPYRSPCDLECDLGIQAEMARRKILRRQSGRSAEGYKKNRDAYLGLLDAMQGDVGRLLRSCTLAARFADRLRGALPLEPSPARNEIERKAAS